MKCLYLVTRSLDPTGKGKARWAMRWKPALNAFAITFEGRMHPGGKLIMDQIRSTVYLTLPLRRRLGRLLLLCCWHDIDRVSHGLIREETGHD